MPTKDVPSFILVEPNFFFSTNSTQWTAPQSVKTTTTGLYHCTNQSGMRQAVPKMGDLEAGQISHSSHVYYQHCPWRRKIFLLARARSCPLRTQSWRRKWGPSMGSEHLGFPRGYKTERAQGSAFLEHTPVTHTNCGTLTAGSDEMASVTGTGIDVNVKSLGQLRKCSVSHESVLPTRYLLGLSPGWRHECTGFACWLSHKRYSQSFLLVWVLRQNKERAHFPHIQGCSLVWTSWS